MKYLKENWLKLREFTFLVLLSAEILLRLLERTRLDLKTPVGYTLVAIELFWIPVVLGLLYGLDILITGIRKNIKKILIDSLIGICFVIAAYSSNDFYILATGALLVNAHKASLKNIAKVVAGSLLFGTVIIGCLSQVGFIEDKLVNRFGRKAHSFGFRHYAFPARQLLFGWLAYMYVKNQKMSWGEIIIDLFLMYVIYYYTTQRLTFIIFILAWLMYIVFVKLELIKVTSKFIKFCSAVGFTVCGIFSIMLSYFYDSSVIWMDKLNSILNTRLELGKEAFNRYDITLFGQYVKDSGYDSPEGYFYIDCGYLDVIISLGIIVFILTTLIYTVIHFYSCVKNDTKLFVWMTSIMIYTIVDNVWVDMIGAGTGIILFGALLNELRKEKYENSIFIKKNLRE